jgi:hypothetical protein
MLTTVDTFGADSVFRKRVPGPDGTSGTVPKPLFRDVNPLVQAI